MLETTTEPVSDIQPKLEQFQHSTEWRALTVKQQKWLIVYLYTNDALAATKSAFSCATETNAKCLSREMQKHKAIVAALDAWTEKSERQIALDKLQRNIDASKPGSVACAKFYMKWLKMKFESDSEAETEAATSDVDLTQPYVGKIVSQNGHNFKVTGVKITSADPVEKTANE
jgi:hypothetical protein